MTGGIKTEESCSKEATDVYLEIQNEEVRRTNRWLLGIAFSSNS